MSAPEYFEVVTSLDRERKRGDELAADLAQLREVVEAEQLKRAEMQNTLTHALATAARGQWAVARVKHASDDVASTMVVQWPLAGDGIVWSRLERGPFGSEFEACVQLLLAVGAYPDTPEGYGDAAAFMRRRARTMAEQANEIVKHPSIARPADVYEPPAWTDAAEATVPPEAWDEVLRRWS